MQLFKNKNFLSFGKIQIIFTSSMKELVRNRFTVFIMTILPVILFSVIYYATATYPMTFMLQSTTITVTMKDVHTVTGSLTALSLLAGIAGFYLAIGSRNVDRRLIAVGFSSITIVLVKLIITLVFVVIGSIFLFGLEMVFHPPNDVVIFFGALLTIGLMYGLIGILVACVLPKEFEGSLIILTLSFLDTMFITNPMSPGTYNTLFSEAFPGYGPVQLVLSASFSGINSGLSSILLLSYFYIFILSLIVGIFYWQSTKLYSRKVSNYNLNPEVSS